jgi:hypothetical protein
VILSWKSDPFLFLLIMQPEARCSGLVSKAIRERLRFRFGATSQCRAPRTKLSKRQWLSTNRGQNHYSTRSHLSSSLGVSPVFDDPLLGLRQS